jgi:hypothetical protein
MWPLAGLFPSAGMVRYPILGISDTLRRAIVGCERCLSPNTLVICSEIVHPTLIRQAVAGALIRTLGESHSM